MTLEEELEQIEQELESNRNWVEELEDYTMVREYLDAIYMRDSLRAKLKKAQIAIVKRDMLELEAEFWKLQSRKETLGTLVKTFTVPNELYYETSKEYHDVCYRQGKIEYDLKAMNKKVEELRK